MVDGRAFSDGITFLVQFVAFLVPVVVLGIVALLLGYWDKWIFAWGAAIGGVVLGMVGAWWIGRT